MLLFLSPVPPARWQYEIVMMQKNKSVILRVVMDKTATEFLKRVNDFLKCHRGDDNRTKIWLGRIRLAKEHRAKGSLGQPSRM